MPSPDLVAGDLAGIRITPLDTDCPAQLDASIALLVDAFGDPLRYGAERLRLELQTADPVFYRKFFVAEADGQVLAFGGVKAADWASRTHILYLSAVAPEKRGRGLGRAMIRARVDWVTGNFKSGRLLVSAAKPRRFRDHGFEAIRDSELDGRQLLIRRF
ncbi:GNAT family N-acetyltransferase [Azonexus caeni]|uniref:GNAT family N-acetyltransferase n=1 Tax=Azonexus caeni TaxID=266126 RepID=UPI003A8505B7